MGVELAGTSTRARRRERLTFTTAAYVRSHGSRPRGYGLWALQRTTTQLALADDLQGVPVSITGTLSQAQRELARRGASGLWAVLP